MHGLRRLIGFSLGLLLLFMPLAAGAAAPEPAAAIEEARKAIEEARLAGAQREAPEEFSQARSWLGQAQKEYEDSQSLLSRTIKLVVTSEAKGKEIVYLAEMAKVKARVAEAKGKLAHLVQEYGALSKELADYRASLEVLKTKLAEAAAAQGVKARAEAELKALEEAKRQVAELEEKKRQALEETKRRAAELEALKERELQEKAARAAAREKETAESRLRAEELAKERQKLEALQRQMAALQREKVMVAEAGRIPQAAVRTTDREIILAIPAVNLFTAKNELHDGGRAILSHVGAFIKRHAIKGIVVRGHTDSAGKAALNQSLSERRALKVKEYLVLNQNIPPADVASEGVGASQPVAGNDTEAGRALNRRVEILLPKGQ